jgi:peptidoglycan/LPS O-acetylase OafA/YrhL
VPSAASDRPTPSATARRPDLQGLRAVAVLLVALNHAEVPFLHGGYVGVDVFFVLSGYFITGLLLRDGFGGEGKGLGAISLGRFYARRARRILPAACLTLLTTSIAVYLLYAALGDDFLATKPVLEDALAASLFFVNFHFIAGANDYFAQAATTLPSPFTHFWSLSVEEQFYLVWPSMLSVVFLGCRRVGRRRPASAAGLARRRRVATALVGGLIVAGCAISLVWSIRETASDASVAYYLTPVRVWEFGLGAGLALLATRSSAPGRLPAALRGGLGWVGAAMIAVAAVRFSASTAFPGDAALLPDGGAALVILAGIVPARRGVDRVLSIRPMTWIGDRSYTFYLWHYPVLILVWQAAGRVLPVLDNLALLGGALMLSALTYACYENPLRFARWLRGWRIALMAPVSMGAAVLAALIPIAVFESTLASQAVAAQRAAATVTPLTPASAQPDPTNLWSSTPIPQVAAAVAAVRRGAALPPDITPSMQELEQENSHISYDTPHPCTPGFGPGVRAHVCRLADRRSSHVVVVLGDSHAGMWMPAVEAAGRRQGFAVVPLDKPGCLLDVLHQNRSGWPCASWYRWALRQDHRLHPTATIVSFELSTELQAEPRATTGMLRAVLGQVTHGVLLADPPGQTQQPPECIARAGASMRTCASRVPGTYVPLMHRLAAMAHATHHPAIPTLQWFCDRGICPMVIDHTLTTRDTSHFTLQFARDLAPVMGPELAPILARLEGGGSAAAGQ